VYFHTKSILVWWRGKKPCPKCAKFIQDESAAAMRPFLAGDRVFAMKPLQEE
jgi:hypothetical protein